MSPGRRRRAAAAAGTAGQASWTGAAGARVVTHAAAGVRVPGQELAPSARAPPSLPPLAEQPMVKVREAPEVKRKEWPSREAGWLVRVAWSQRPFTYAFGARCESLNGGPGTTSP